MLNVYMMILGASHAPAQGKHKSSVSAMGHYWVAVKELKLSYQNLGI